MSPNIIFDCYDSCIFSKISFYFFPLTIKLLIVNNARPLMAVYSGLAWKQRPVHTWASGGRCERIIFSPTLIFVGFFWVCLANWRTSRFSDKSWKARECGTPLNNKTCGEVFGRFVLSAGIKCRDLRWKCRRLSGKSYAPRGISGLLDRNSFVQANEV